MNRPGVDRIWTWSISDKETPNLKIDIVPYLLDKTVL